MYSSPQTYVAHSALLYLYIFYKEHATQVRLLEFVFCIPSSKEGICIYGDKPVDRTKVLTIEGRMHFYLKIQ